MDFADITADQVAAVDEMAALSATITTALRSAQRAYDDCTDDRLDQSQAAEVRRLIAKGQARAEAEFAMEQALCGQVPTGLMRSVEGMHSPATLVSTLLGADDAEVNGLMLDALRLACASHPGQTRAERDAGACLALRKLGDLLAQRFGAEHFTAYLVGAL